MLSNDELLAEVEKWDKLLWKLVNTYKLKCPKAEVEELFAWARFGFCEARLEYDGSTQYQTYAMLWAKKRVIEYLRGEVNFATDKSRFTQVLYEFEDPLQAAEWIEFALSKAVRPELLRLHFVEGLTQREIARRTGESLACISRSINADLQVLHRVLAEDNPNHRRRQSERTVRAG